MSERVGLDAFLLGMAAGVNVGLAVACVHARQVFGAIAHSACVFAAIGAWWWLLA